MIPPLNGKNTHALTPHALSVLRDIARRPVPASEVNPGVRNRFDREGLVAWTKRPSPFKTHRGKMIDYLELSDAGRDALRGTP